MNVARDFSPRFSPDGKWIAFTSTRTGNNDVFIMPSTGGEPKQLTWYSGDDQALYWTPDGKGVVISSARGANAWGSPLYVQPIDGSIARPLGMGIARAGMISQDGNMIAFNRNLPSTWRKEYRGNAAANIAVMNVSNGSINELTNTDLQKFKTFANNVFPMWGADGMIYFASETRRHVQPLAHGAQGRRGAAGDELQERRRVLPVDLARRKAHRLPERLRPLHGRRAERKAEEAQPRALVRRQGLRRRGADARRAAPKASASRRAATTWPSTSTARS